MFSKDDNTRKGGASPRTLEEAGFVDYKTSVDENKKALSSKVDFAKNENQSPKNNFAKVETTQTNLEKQEYHNDNMSFDSDAIRPQRNLRQVYEPPLSEEGIHKSRMPKYVEAWGFAVASARFRGFLVIFLTLSLVASSMSLFVTNLMLSRREYFVVGIDNEGRPSMLNQTSMSARGPEVFIRDFVSSFMNYSPSTVDDNMKRALGVSTSEFASQWNSRFGSSWVSTVKRERIVQTVAINRIEISTMESRQFTADVWTVRYRSSDNERSVIQDQVKYELSVFVTTPTTQNPWGYYVQAMKEGRY